MIDIIDDVIKIIKSIPALENRVYRSWAQKKLKFPSAVVRRMSGTPILTDDKGDEITSSLVYSIDVNASTMKEVDEIASAIVDQLARYNIHRTGFMDMHDDNLKVYRAVISVSVIVDKRGNTFTN